MILFKKNIKSRPQVQKLIRNLQKINRKKFPHHPLLIAVDQEGGSVSPLEGLIPPSPGNMALAASGSLTGAREIAGIMGANMRQLGFNVNFAPVLDVNCNPENPIIGIRSFGDEPVRVGKFGKAAIQGYQSQGIMATAKHFPGHGDTIQDSHLNLPIVRHSKKRIESVELPPFQTAIQADVWSVMTAHVIFPALDEYPATLSKKILTDLLRKKLGFKGLIFSDSFSMAAVKKHYRMNEAVILSVEAGADILLALGARAFQQEIHSILAKAIENQYIAKPAMQESLNRIFYFRKKLGEFRKPSTIKLDNHLLKTLHEKSVTVIHGEKNLPLSNEALIFLSPEATKHRNIFQNYFKKMRSVAWPWPKAQLAARKRKWFFLTEPRLISSQAVDAVQKNNPWECIVAFGNPYLLKKLPQAAVQITTYHSNALLVKAASDVILEGKKAAGKLPIAL